MMILNLDNEQNLNFFGTEGSGNQQKCWIVKDDKDYLIKINSSKYREASKEESVSKILDAAKIPHAHYRKIEVVYDGKKKIACITPKFTSKNENTYPLYMIIDENAYVHSTNGKDRFSMIVNAVSKNTNIERQAIIDYLMTMLVVDYLVINPDRHLSNIELITDNKGNNRFAPLFDFGQSFLGYERSIPDYTFKGLEQKSKALPFSSNPEKNLINIKYAKNICYRLFSSVDIESLSIPNFHKYVFKYRYNKLLNLKDSG